MQDEPCGFLRHANVTRELAGTDAFLVRGHQENSDEPRPQRNLAVLENRSVAYREFLAAIAALVRVVRQRVMRCDYAAMRACDLVRFGPTQRSEVIDANVLVRERFLEVCEAFVTF